MAEETKKEEVVETTELQVSEDLFDESFKEASEGTPAKSETTPETKPEEKPPEKIDEPKKEEEAKLTPDPDEVKSLKKQLEDTKRWGTESATKVAELTKRLETAEKKSPEKVVEEEIPADIKAFYEDYPEFKKAVDFEVDRRTKGMTPGTPKEDVLAPVMAEIGQLRFERAVVNGVVDKDGNFIDGHPDAMRIVLTKEFKSWAEKEKVTEISDPIEAIKAISRFKETKVREATREHDKKVGKEAEERKQAASASISSTKGGSRGSGSVDKQDYDAGWDEAVKSAV